MTYKCLLPCRKYSLLLLCLLYLQFVNGQSSFDKADQWLKDNVKDLGGRAVLVIFKDGKIIYNHAENDMTRRQKMIGKFIARRKGKDPEEVLSDYNSTTKEMIASCSKWLSAALVMTFVDDGQLRLEDSIGKYLPVMTANGKGGITIWQCLSHLTGIKGGSIKDFNETMKNISSMGEVMGKIAIMPMEGEPGKTFHYSGVGLQIAGAILEKISGKSFETLFEERIARPCGMTNTDFGPGKVAQPAGSARSTAEDYTRFLSMILNEGMDNGKQVLSRHAVIEMQKNRVPKGATIAYTPSEAGDWGYGFGEWVMDGASAETRSNKITSPGLFGSFPWVDNELKYAGFLFTFNINTKGRHARYTELKNIADDVVKNNR